MSILLGFFSFFFTGSDNCFWEFHPSSVTLGVFVFLLFFCICFKVGIECSCDELYTHSEIKDQWPSLLMYYCIYLRTLTYIPMLMWLVVLHVSVIFPLTMYSMPAWYTVLCSCTKKTVQVNLKYASYVESKYYNLMYVYIYVPMYTV